VVVVVAAIGASLWANRASVGVSSPSPEATTTAQASPTATPWPGAKPSVDLGIFVPVAGRIVYRDDDGIWGVDPAEPAAATRVRLTSEEGIPLGWSRDGTELLIMRRDPTPPVVFASNLFILHADGTETQLTKDGMEVFGAAIAPDGSRVVYAARDARSVPPSLYVVDSEGGEPVQIADAGEWPTFSPDGSQIAYAVNNIGQGHVWVADADGSNAHEILAGEPTLLGGVDELAWSPTGDRIAMGDQGEGHVAIYTFAPGGSDFTTVITGGFYASWSPDGSQMAFLRPYDGPRPGLAIADADGSNVREFGFGAAGPWHPGTPSPSDESTPSPQPSPSPGLARFISAVHGISIDYPAFWQTRVATEPWSHDAVTFGAPDVDVIFDPALQDDLYIAVVSEPLDGQAADDWCCSEPLSTSDVCRAGSDMGSYTVDTAHGWILGCGGVHERLGGAGNHVLVVATATRGYIIQAHVGNAWLLETYDRDWFEAALERVEFEEGNQ
jgi:hypothetical protein